jgi:dihydroorotase
MLYGRHLQLIMPALGHPTKTALRKAAHTVLLNTVKTYPQFNLLVGIYLNNGILS